MTIQMPQIDVQGLFPVAGLVVIALAAVIGIVLWVALRSGGMAVRMDDLPSDDEVEDALDGLIG